MAAQVNAIAGEGVIHNQHRVRRQRQILGAGLAIFSHPDPAAKSGAVNCKLFVAGDGVRFAVFVGVGDGVRRQRGRGRPRNHADNHADGQQDGQGLLYMFHGDCLLFCASVCMLRLRRNSAARSSHPLTPTRRPVCHASPRMAYPTASRNSAS